MADGVLVVLHHHQGVALVAEGPQGTEQDGVVAGVQADGGLVQHVAHALQVAAQLRRQADALRFAAAEGGRATVQRQVAQADRFQKLQPALDLGQQVARDVGRARLQRRRQPLHPVAHGVHVKARNVGNADALKAHGARRGVQARALAAGAGVAGEVADVGFGKGLLAPVLVLGLDRIVEHLALLLGQRQSRADAVRAPAVLAVVAKEAWVEFDVGSGAHRAGAPGRKHLHAANVGGGGALLHGRGQRADVAEHVYHALAMRQRLRQGLAQRRLLRRLHVQAGHRQLDAVFLEAVQARELLGGQKVAVDAQVRVAAPPGPFRQVGVDALARAHQGREQADVLAAKALEQLRGDAVGRLRLHRSAVVQAVLHTQLDVEQAQEMPDLGGGADGGLAPATREALLDGHGGRDAVDRIDLGPPRRLDDGAGVGIEAFQVAPLALVEQDVKGQGRLAGAGDAGDDVEAGARDGHAQGLQVVLARVQDSDRLLRRAGCGPRQRRLLPGAALAHRVHHAECRRIVAQGACGVRMRVQHQRLGAADGDQFATALAAFGAQVDEPVAGADHVQVVLDHQQRVPGVEQAAQRVHELGNVVKVQAGGGLVEHEQRALFRQRLAAGAAGLGGVGQKAGELETLRLAAREGRHGLAQAHVFQTHVDDGLQGADDVAVALEQLRRLAHGELQHIGHVQPALPAFDLHLQDFGAVALAVAVRAAQVDVAEKLHFDVLKARAAAARAAPVTAVEAEFACRIAALARQIGATEDFAQRVPGTDVAHRVGARRLANGRLVHKHHLAELLGAQQAAVRPGRLRRLAEVA